MAKVSEIAKYVWQSPAWPNFKFSRAALADELSLFAKAFADAKRALKKPQPLEDVASAMAEEAVRTSAIEGVEVDESVVMSSICRALGVAYAPSGFPRDARAEGVAQMMLSVRRDWDKPLSVELLKGWHGSLLANNPRGLKAGVIVAEGDGPITRYRLNCPLCEPIDPINNPISGSVAENILRLVIDNPGINRERLASRVGRSVETVKRTIAALVAAGRIEHRGSKKTGGYFPLEQNEEDHTGTEP